MSSSQVGKISAMTTMEMPQRIMGSPDASPETLHPFLSKCD